LAPEGPLLHALAGWCPGSPAPRTVEQASRRPSAPLGVARAGRRPESPAPRAVKQARQSYHCCMSQGAVLHLELDGKGAVVLGFLTAAGCPAPSCGLATRAPRRAAAQTSHAGHSPNHRAASMHVAGLTPPSRDPPLALTRDPPSVLLLRGEGLSGSTAAHAPPRLHRSMRAWPRAAAGHLDPTVVRSTHLRHARPKVERPPRRHQCTRMELAPPHI
jgi:hypothetical protein